MNYYLQLYTKDSKCLSVIYCDFCLFSKHRCHEEQHFFYKGNSTMTNFYGLLYFLNSPFFQMTGYKTMTDVTVFMIPYPYVHLYFLCGLMYNMGVFPCLSHEVLTALNVGNNNTHKPTLYFQSQKHTTTAENISLKLDFFSFFS